MLRSSFVMLILFSILISCNSSPDRSINKFSDPELVKIYELKDRRQSDSLYQYLTHENPEYRREAAFAFGSVQDSLSVFRIGKLLTREKDPAIRKAAAFAIGQTRSPHSERILLGALTKETDAGVLREILQAYGKATRHWQLVNPSLFHDTVKAEGLAWSIYRAGLNGKTDSITNRVASDLLRVQYDENTRLAAAHFFSRSATGFEEFFQPIMTSAKSDPSIEVRMAALHSLRKIKTPESLQSIKNLLDSEKDYRLRVNAVRALQSFSFAETKSSLYKALLDKQVNVSIAASEAVSANAASANWIELSNIADQITNWRAQAIVFEAALKNSGNDLVVGEIKKKLDVTNDPYHRAALLSALQHHYPSLPLLKKEMMEATKPVIATTAAVAICNLNNLSNFSHAQKEEFVETARAAVAKGDPGVIGIFCAALSNKKFDYRSVVSDISFLKEAREKLSLPKDNESIQPLEEAIAYFENRKPDRVLNTYNHPIDWKYVQRIPSDQKMLIRTTKGNITIRLAVEEAPGSVENFMKLAAAGYFDNKPFHRTVPNFVIQDGCNRGDGFGSEDYSIRSEFSYRGYKTGSVGMASAGKDTEGTQWFITHSPTPHLDGRYTIFADVIEGIEAVHLIEVGDEIISIKPTR